MITCLIAGCLALSPQATPWTPPPTKLPAEFVRAVEFLHRHGMADPRGGELRRVEIAEGSPLRGGKALEVCGWLMPAAPGEPRKLVTLKGLAYPVNSAGKPATLDEAVEKALYTRYGSAFGSGPPMTTTSVVAAQLLVLGEVERAEKVYVANRWKPFVDLAKIFLAQWWDLAATAHMRGDAETALRVARAFEEQRPAFEREALRVVGEKELRASYYGGKRDGPEAILSFQSFGSLDGLIRDSERRLKRGQRPLDLASIRKLPQRERIARLVESLDELSPDAWSFARMADDTHNQALVGEGNAAVDPLFNALERDVRLTRCVRGMGDDVRGDRYVVPVRTAARNAITDILGVYAFGDPPSTTATYTGIRALWRRTREMRPVDRWVYVLNDDAAGRDRWHAVARNLFRASNILPTHESYRYTRWEPTAPPPPVWFHTLPPSVQDQVRKDLIARTLTSTQPPMSRESWATEHAFGFARHLAIADPEGGRAAIEAAIRMGIAETVPDQYGNSRFSQHGPTIGALVAAVGRSGNDAIVDRYLSWLDKTKPVGGYDLDRVFEPLVKLRHDPKVQRVTKRLFTADDSPWNLRRMATQPQYGAANSFLYSPLFRLDPIRGILLDLLEDKTVIGHVIPNAKGDLLFRTVAGEEIFSLWNSKDPLAPILGEVRTIRVCDRAVAGAAAFGKERLFQLYWPSADKDRLIEETKAYIREHGSEIADRLSFSDLRD